VLHGALSVAPYSQAFHATASAKLAPTKTRISLGQIHDDDSSIREHWALLVAGSSGWGANPLVRPLQIAGAPCFAE
jgi:hypothetical protein